VYDVSTVIADMESTEPKPESNMKHVYTCTKNGRDYIYESANVVLPTPQDEFAWHYGINIYADRYHASVTKKGQNAFTGTDDEYNAEIDRLCVEARDRWHMGDLPGQRAKPSPQQTEARALAAAAMANPELAAAMKAVVAKFAAKTQKAA